MILYDARPLLTESHSWVIVRFLEYHCSTPDSLKHEEVGSFHFSVLYSLSRKLKLVMRSYYYRERAAEVHSGEHSADRTPLLRPRADILSERKKLLTPYRECQEHRGRCQGEMTAERKGPQRDSITERTWPRNHRREEKQNGRRSKSRQTQSKNLLPPRDHRR